MKRILLFLLVSLLLCSCNESSETMGDAAGDLTPDNNVVETIPDKSAKDPNRIDVEGVLDGSVKLYEGDTETTLAELWSATMNTPGQYAMCDLDGDGTEEMIVQFSPSRETAILRLENGLCKVYHQSYRNIIELKTDGTAIFAAGTSYSGIHHFTFEGDMKSNEILVQNGDDYTLNGEPIDEDTYNSEVSAQDAKEGVNWIEIK